MHVCVDFCAHPRARATLDLVGWLVGWLAGWLAGWLVCWLVGWQAPKIQDEIVGFATAGACVSLPVPPALRNLNTLLFERCALLLRGVVQGGDALRRRVRRNQSLAWGRLVTLHAKPVGGRSGSVGGAAAGAAAAAAAANAVSGLCHRRLQSLPGLPLSFHREWVATLCAAEGPVHVITIATHLEREVLEGAAHVRRCFAGGRAVPG